MDVDYLVIGGGAAGCTLGWHLRQAGTRVLVIELRDAQSKDKLCGGIFGMASLAELAASFGKDALDELDLMYPPRHRYRCLGRESVSNCAYATVVRKRLDDWLLSRYIGAGGVLHDRMRVLSFDQEAHVVSCKDLRTGARREVSYGALIGADGALSVVRRLATGRSQASVMALEGAVRTTREDIVFSYDPKKRGYCWYIPSVADANVGCMSYGDDVSTCRAWLLSFCEDMGIAMPALKGAAIPTGEDICLRAGEHTYLVGDAAGLTSPIDGGGIHFALASGRLLATSLLGGHPYEEAMDPIVKSLTAKAAKRDETYLRTCLFIAIKGSAIQSA